MNSAKIRLPANRSFEQVRRHYEVEKALARQLLAADAEERSRIYRSMYDTLFREVPDHPRLGTRESEARTAYANRSKLSFLKKHIDRHSTVLEFAPGDCKFAKELSDRVSFVYAVDIADQRGNYLENKQNMELMIYDGYSLVLGDSIIDIIFSDHLIEHLHPEDVHHHFNLAMRLLTPGGKYLFRTPHAFTGPHDISKYFSDTPEGFHLKEWTVTELETVLKKIGFRQVHCFWAARNFRLRLPVRYFRFAEEKLRHLPSPWRRSLAAYLLRTINIMAVK